MSVAVVMPVWNEAEGIGEFLTEIAQCFANESIHFFVVNDCSTDNTDQVLEQLSRSDLLLTVLENPRNMGHGPSTLRALAAGLDSGADVVVAVDGDGQFLGSDIRHVADLASAPGTDFVEGVRTSRDDPYFRRIASMGTRILVGLRCGRFPDDANTPLRGYKRAALRSALTVVPNGASTPNLFISAYVRKSPLDVSEVRVQSLPRRGKVTTGSTWGRSRSYMPSKRFLTFCANAVREWVSTPLPRDVSK